MIAALLSRLPVTLWGSRFHAPTADRWLALQLHRIGVMGGTHKRLLTETVRPGMCAVDVGANQGIASLLLSRLVGPEGKVIALEPDPRMAAALQKNLRTNGVTNVDLLIAGAGAESGEATLFLSAHNSGDNRLSHGDLPTSCPRFKVPIVRLDDVVPERKIDFLKIDTQGWEISVLEGAAACVSASPTLKILCEFWPHGLRQAGREPESLVHTLLDMDFALQILQHSQPVTRDTIGSLMSRCKGKRYLDLVATRR